jgi:hypothetical protein
MVWAIGSGASLVRVILGVLPFMKVTRHAPDDWGWSADWAAWLLQADSVQAGYELNVQSNPSIATALNEDMVIRRQSLNRLPHRTALSSAAPMQPPSGSPEWRLAR